MIRAKAARTSIPKRKIISLRALCLDRLRKHKLALDRNVLQSTISMQHAICQQENNANALIRPMLSRDKSIKMKGCFVRWAGVHTYVWLERRAIECIYVDRRRLSNLQSSDPYVRSRNIIDRLLELSETLCISGKTMHFPSIIFMSTWALGRDGVLHPSYRNCYHLIDRVSDEWVRECLVV